MTKSPDISIIVPMYNEHEVIDKFFKEIRKVLDKISQYSYEIICINDGSKDNTLEILKQFAKQDKHIKIISFSRNFHKEAALSAGIDLAQGRCIIPIDADLQHPVNKIPEFIEKWQQGYKVVYGIKKSRDKDSFLKRLTAKYFYTIYNKLCNNSLPRNASDFILLDREVVETLKKYKEKNRFMRILFFQLGYKSTTVEYAINDRAEGTTKWNYWKLWNFALDGITASSTFPLRVWTYLGGLIAFFSFLSAAYIIIKTLMFGDPVQGYPTLAVMILFFGGIQLIALGVIGEYVGRIMTEVKNRPLYIIEEKVNFDD